MRVNAVTSKLNKIFQLNHNQDPVNCLKNLKTQKDTFEKNINLNFKGESDIKTPVYPNTYLEASDEELLDILKNEYEETKKHDYTSEILVPYTSGGYYTKVNYQTKVCYSAKKLIEQIENLIRCDREQLAIKYRDYATNPKISTAQEAMNFENEYIKGDVEKLILDTTLLYKDTGKDNSDKSFVSCANYEDIMKTSDDVFRKYFREKLKDGNIGELRSRYPKRNKIINEVLDEMGLTPYGMYKTEIKIQYPTLSTLKDFQKKNEEITLSAKETKKRIYEEAKRELPEGIDRVGADLVTLGLHELYRIGKKIIITRKPLKKLKEENVASRKQLANKAQAEAQNYEKSIRAIEKGITKLQALKNKEEKIKEILTEGLINKINNLYQGIPVRNMPNCVMFEGENPFKAKELSNWVSQVTDTYFEDVSSNQDKDLMKQNIYQKLEKAEKNYQETGKRTIMFIEGFDKLLIENENPNSMIASMKDIMQCTNEDYHTTIMFYGPNADKYAKGINTSGRIGLKVPIDITHKEANIQGMFTF